MSRGWPLLASSLAGLALGIVMIAIGLASTNNELHWGAAHGRLLLAGFLLPGMMFLQVHVVSPLVHRRLPKAHAAFVAAFVLSGAMALALGHLFQPSSYFATLATAGAFLVFVGGAWHALGLLQILPRHNESVVDQERDPLSKGDDASLLHIKVATILLPASLLLWAFTYLPLPAILEAGVEFRIGSAAMHLFLLGYVLPSIYGLSHIVIPRFSGVPAIAAGAIKGELHSTLLGTVGVVTGLLYGWTWALVAFGPFVFLGAFTFMGVLGANIMRNKSRTQRVTPLFAYVPWTFAGVCWLLCGVLLGIFLAIVPDILSDHEASLRFTHVHLALFGGATMLFLGYLYRLLPTWRGVDPPPFAVAKWSFLAFHLSLLLVIVGAFQGSSQVQSAGGLVGALALLLCAWSLRNHFPLPAIGRP